jgi:hypothetical protein
MSHHKGHSEPRRIHRLMDEVYREMFRLEAGYPGAEMGLALALLHAWAAADFRAAHCADWEWLRTICPMGLKMIEDSLNRGSTLETSEQRAN